MTLICSKCGVEKPVEAFPVRRDRYTGRGTVCLECGRLYRKAHYQANRSRYIARARAARPKRRSDAYARLIEHLRTHPCVDCGERDIRVLQFDHVDPAAKLRNVGAVIREGTWSRAVIEIAKCEVRCGNCHRRRTLRQKRSGLIGEDAAKWDWPVSIESRWAVSSVDRAAVF